MCLCPGSVRIPLEGGCGAANEEAERSRAHLIHAPERGRHFRTRLPRGHQRPGGCPARQDTQHQGPGAQGSGRHLSYLLPPLLCRSGIHRLDAEPPGFSVRTNLAWCLELRYKLGEVS